MIHLRLLLGLIPNTEKLESRENALWAEFREFTSYAGSEELKRYQELDKLINSPEFPRRVNAVKAQKYSDTEEFRKEQEFKKIQKDPRWKTYIKVKNSATLAAAQAFEKSPEYQRLEELDKIVTSQEFRQKRSSMSSREFRVTPESDLWNEYLQLKKSPEARKYFSFKASPKYGIYSQVDSSDLPGRYMELEQYLASEDFRKVKEYMLLPPKKKYLLSEEYKLLQEYLTLKKSEKIRWFFKVQKQDKFRELKKLTLKFEDDFAGKTLDTSKWITRYFWGETILKDAYSLASDKHFLTDGKNLELDGSMLKIITRKEEVTGKAWDPALGFYPKDFSYTSGIINTGKSFRQQYGIIQAKVRLNNPGKVTHAFWLTGDRIIPQVDVFKTDNSKILLSTFWGNITEKDGIRHNTIRLSASRLMKGFYIFTLEWSPSSLVWKVNGVKLAEMKEAVPQEPLYLNFSSGIYKDNVDGSLPATFEIDWVKVYEKTE